MSRESGVDASLLTNRIRHSSHCNLTKKFPFNSAAASRSHLSPRPEPPFQPWTRQSLGRCTPLGPYWTQQICFQVHSSCPRLLTSAAVSMTQHRSPRSLSSAQVYTGWKNKCADGEKRREVRDSVFCSGHDNAGESCRKGRLKTHFLLDDWYMYWWGSWRRGAILGACRYQITRMLALRLEQAKNSEDWYPDRYPDSGEA